MTGGQVVGSLGKDYEVRTHAPKIQTPVVDFAVRTEKQTARFIVRYELLHEAARLLHNHRIAKCSWYKMGAAVIMKNDVTGKTSYGKTILMCGCAWLCPVCSVKITEKHRIEVRAGVDAWQAKNGGIFMITPTLQHTKEDNLDELLKIFCDALRWMQKQRSWKQFLKKYQIVGNIRAIESTCSFQNGHHPHGHTLYFSKCKYPDIYAIKADFLIMWKAALAKFGRYCSDEHGVTVREGDKAISDYLAKMGVEMPVTNGGIDYEMTNGLKKSGRDSGHYTPFELLALSARGDKWAGKMYKEYAAATKGVNQVRWSSGLRKLLGVTDELVETIQKQNNPNPGVKREFYKFADRDWKIALVDTSTNKLRNGVFLDTSSKTDEIGFDTFIKFVVELEERRRKDYAMVEEARLLGGVVT